MFPIKRYFAIAMIAVLMLTALAPVLAAETEEQKQQLEEIQRQMQQQQNKVSQAQRQVNNLAEQLQVIQEDYDSALGDYKAIQAKRTAAEQQIRVNTELLAKTEKDLEVRTQILNKRMRDIYENGQISYLDVLVGAADFRDFTTRVDILQRVLRQDTNLIAKVKAERELVIQTRAQLEQDRAAIAELEKVAAEKKNIIESRKNERENVLSVAVNDRDSAERAYQELQDTSRRIERMIRNRESGTKDSAGSTGTMAWPIEGPITSPYGWRTHPIFGTARYHSGVDIGADYGDPIRAADGGVVIYADWMGGYGKAVIIDHGGGITTLYGHNSELVVGEGQRVRKGQLIARAGATGYATGPHCHFEVRQNGSPVDPMGYLP
ncbi:MAG: peptidoglycan DD-metalloendopeptidase family protein [Negativicutes bacterium]|nr:peptidoglycan DD-metalloendopeptidase family protein [Negativicutes bacterium]